MIGAGLALKVAVPVLIATGGAVAIAVVPDPAATAARLWIDSPSNGATVAPGEVVVVAHAADDLALDSMTLEVDGKDVATVKNLQTYDRLASAQFDWTATNGEHVLVVTGGGLESERVAVLVGTPSALGTPAVSRAPSVKPSPTTAPTPSVTPSPSVSSSATSTRTPTPRPSPARPTRKPTKPAPPPKPQVVSVSVNPGSVSGGTCTGTITVTAKVKDATGGSAQVIGEGVGSPVNNNIGGNVSGDTFTATFKQRDLTGNNLSGPFRVEVTVTNSQGFDVGAASMTIACAKD